jgi:hypothetical protein
VRKLCVIPVPPLAVDTRRAIPEVEGDVNGWALFDMHTSVSDAAADAAAASADASAAVGRRSGLVIKWYCRVK